jgi:hypothetical protein
MSCIFTYSEPVFNPELKNDCVSDLSLDFPSYFAFGNGWTAILKKHAATTANCTFMKRYDVSFVPQSAI